MKILNKLLATNINELRWNDVNKSVKDEICHTSCKYKDVCSRDKCYTFLNFLPYELPKELKEVEKEIDRNMINECIDKLDFTQDILYRKNQLEALGFKEKFVYYYRECFNYGFTSELYSEDEELQMISDKLKSNGHENIIMPFTHKNVIIVPLVSMTKVELKMEVEEYLKRYRYNDIVDSMKTILITLSVIFFIMYIFLLII